ncbi:hypothetical protein [Pseudobacteroides cellulosolvens]|uniref:Uncharacterized protein n=1 Tax=Pseudobacteroides cellulosolvens ATCC 35603 = DSM 2933 TaxID=398512 RepID=A0A0L6JJ11_9FIRM|nr:hypothetical protein [Pseudobacteroides cellulosolvens]KNY25705.1 hypothetical protein Bccel_0965 [Pseudobacteroides cellulosolvens ATCC 35603 = DSM 2933]
MAVYEAVYGTYYEYQTLKAVNDAISLINIFFGFFIATVVVLIFVSCFNRNS